MPAAPGGRAVTKQSEDAAEQSGVQVRSLSPCPRGKNSCDQHGLALRKKPGRAANFGYSAGTLGIPRVHRQSGARDGEERARAKEATQPTPAETRPPPAQDDRKLKGSIPARPEETCNRSGSHPLPSHRPLVHSTPRTLLRNPPKPACYFLKRKQKYPNQTQTEIPQTEPSLQMP